MAGLEDIFKETKAKSGYSGATQVQPALPVGAFSGNPAATVTNLSAIGGAIEGKAIGGALSSLVRGVGDALIGPQVNPQELQAQQQEEFARRLSAMNAAGTGLPGENVKRVAEQMRREGRLAADQYFKASAAGADMLKSDRSWLSSNVEFVNESKAVKEYIAAKSTFSGMQKLAAFENDRAKDFLLIQQGLKLIDPTSITSNNEINTAWLNTTGYTNLSRILGDMGVTIDGLTRYFATGGRSLTLNERQKERWMQGMAEILAGKQQGARDVHAMGLQQYVGGGGNENAFNVATKWRADDSDFIPRELVDRATYGTGTAPDIYEQLVDRALDKADERADKIKPLLSKASGVIGELAVDTVGAFAKTAVGAAMSAAGVGDMPDDADLVDKGIAMLDKAVTGLVRMDDDEAARLVQQTMPEEYRTALRKDYPHLVGPGGLADETLMMAQDRARGSPTARALGIDYAKGLWTRREALISEKKKRQRKARYRDNPRKIIDTQNKRVLTFPGE